MNLFWAACSAACLHCPKVNLSSSWCQSKPAFSCSWPSAWYGVCSSGFFPSWAEVLMTANAVRRRSWIQKHHLSLSQLLVLLFTSPGVVSSFSLSVFSSSSGLPPARSRNHYWLYDLSQFHLFVSCCCCCFCFFKSKRVPHITLDLVSMSQSDRWEWSLHRTD